MQTVRIELDRLYVNPLNPRREFPEDGLRALAESIRRYGLLSPLLVRRVAVDRFCLVAGERRLRALRLLNAVWADCVIFTASDEDSRILALVENIQREDLHFLDEARACMDVLRDTRMPQEALARRIGKSPSALNNRLRLLKLPEAVLQEVRAHPGLTERHVRALLRLSRAEDMLLAVRETVEGKLNVRATENLIEKLLARPAQTHIKHCIRDERVFLNAVLNAVRSLNTLGVPAVSRVERLPDRVEITVTLPALATLPRSASPVSDLLPTAAAAPDTPFQSPAALSQAPAALSLPASL